jgi:hypothetical protein
VILMRLLNYGGHSSLGLLWQYATGATGISALVW